MAYRVSLAKRRGYRVLHKPRKGGRVGHAHEGPALMLWGERRRAENDECQYRDVTEPVHIPDFWAWGP